VGKLATIGLDTAKHIFQVHGAEGSSAVMFRRKLRRAQVLGVSGILCRAALIM
jgi:hypothetical protein